MGELGIDLERDPPVAGLLTPLEHLSQQIAGVSHVHAGQREEYLLGVGLMVKQAAQLLVVSAPLSDRLLKDRRVRSDSDNSPLDECSQLSVPDKGSREKVDPRALSGLSQGL